MDGSGKTWRQLLVIGIMEAIGTAILFIAINFSAGNPVVVVTGIFTGAILSGRLTGAHFNAAVTVAVMLADEGKKFKANLPLAAVLILSQILGGYIGQSYAYLELDSQIAVIGPQNPDDYPPWKVFLVELLFTTLLMICILHNIFARLSIQSDTVLAVGAVCISIYFCIGCVGPLTGGCFNPVVGLVNVTFVALVKERNFLKYLPSYLFGPLLGGIIAAVFCKYILIPQVPPHYNNMIESIRQDLSSRYENVNGSQKYVEVDRR